MLTLDPKAACEGGVKRHLARSIRVQSQAIYGDDWGQDVDTPEWMIVEKKNRMGISCALCTGFERGHLRRGGLN